MVTAREYHMPLSPDEALAIKKASPSAEYLAGGTVINTFRRRAGSLICLNKLGMSDVSDTKVGSTATLQDIAGSHTAHPALRKSAFDLANRNIRNMATIGGNIAANKPGSDMIGTLIVMDAELEIYISEGAPPSRIPVSEWIKSPEGLISSVRLSRPEKEVFIERYSRTRNDISLMKFTAGYRADEDILGSLRIAVSSMADHVVELKQTTVLMNNIPFCDIDREAVIASAQAEVFPVDDHRASAWYRRSLLTAALDKFLKEICS
jgi:CO/xanthine dehydrogenase FAD-binding subunit